MLKAEPPHFTPCQAGTPCDDELTKSPADLRLTMTVPPGLTMYQVMSPFSPVSARQVKVSTAPPDQGSTPGEAINTPKLQSGVASGPPVHSNLHR